MDGGESSPSGSSCLETNEARLPRAFSQLVFLLALLLRGLAAAQAFNVDFGFDGGTGEPSDSFSGAAGRLS